ncbi:hypothetical protein BAE44_0013634 [Dichanthelium oligosanthes]|uniref:Uncharacterized protein n=1 Tax=Dichanthelium oligosanthes TaxID=888268 RepID=A0A1E5VJR5_9POAL|nr:hypothetical protein BAE44_0013634 [Dichanthelium oligosanthes]
MRVRSIHSIFLSAGCVNAIIYHHHLVSLYPPLPPNSYR